MGRDKARLPFRGRPLAEHVAEVLSRELPNVVLVTRDPDDRRFPDWPRVADRFPGHGPLAGLHAALLHATQLEAAQLEATQLEAAQLAATRRGPRGRPVFLAACDLPGLTPELVRHVLGPGFPAGTGAAARVPLADGRLQPLAALYSPGCLAVVTSSLERGERAVHRFLDRIEVTTVPLTPDLPFYRRHLLANVNRPRDLDRFLARSGEER